MHILRRVFVSVGALLLAGCASHRIQRSAQGDLRLERTDIVELNEAFKNSSGEKTVTLGSHGELSCSERRCRLPIEGMAEVYEGPTITDRVKARGVMAFDVDTIRHLLDLLDDAREFSREKADRGKIGAVVCDGKACVLSFTFQKGEIIAASQLVTPPEARPIRKKRSDYTP